MTEPIKPCPFCGEIPNADDERNYQTSDGKWGRLICGCSAQGPEVRTLYTPWTEWREDAIRAWNKRAAPQRDAEKIRAFALRLAFALADHRFAEMYGDKAEAKKCSVEADKVWGELMAAIDAACAGAPPDAPVVGASGSDFIAHGGLYRKRVDAGAPPKDDERLDALAHEIWAAAQLVPGEGIVDGVDRIAAILKGNGNG